MSFLKAEWRKLVLFNYVVEPEVLVPHLPFGTELDLWEGKCYLSVVGFLFQNTKLLGVKIPFHSSFEEVNLRFYVKRIVNGETRRGVVFIKEIVPKWALSFVANTIYKEHYVTKPMKYNWTSKNDVLRVEYQWKLPSGWQQITVRAKDKLVPIPEGSEAEFITEHYWGYAKVSAKKTNEYEVTHPRWSQYPVLGATTDFDFKLNYGAEFTFLNDVEPTSVLLAEGSEITVESKRRL
ncbi:MAG: DUF2071 domain-containing protein [Flavobacteriaceae bacterium]|nr:DUF2071 domain-containing protein [Flavobacteriaceae bacterium]